MSEGFEPDESKADQALKRVLRRLAPLGRDCFEVPASDSVHKPVGYCICDPCSDARAKAQARRSGG